MTSLSAEQQNLIDNIKPPKGWDRPNPTLTPALFPYHNSFISPAWTSGLQGGASVQIPKIGGPYNYSNQFTSALTQPRNPANNVPQAGKGSIVAEKEPVLDMVNPFSKKKHKRIRYSK